MTRTFLYPVSDVRRFRLMISKEEDNALPAPLEPEQWEETEEITIEQIESVLAALLLRKNIADLETKAPTETTPHSQP
tara:strand:+ start:266 stop:499 length:234 start_codon:yes stop_codon:yes gene_type:complete